MELSRPKKEDIVIWIAFLALIFLGIFVGFQELAKDYPSFLFLMFSSFIFLGVGTFLLFLAMAVKGHWALSIVAIIFIVATLFVGNSIATVPREKHGHNYHVVSPSSVEGLVEYKYYDEAGWEYYEDFTQTLLEVDYPVRYVRAYYDWEHVTLYVKAGSKNVSLSGQVTLQLSLEPNRLGDLSMVNFKPYKGTTTLSGNGTVRSNVGIYGGLIGSWGRARLDNGYRIKLYIYFNLKGVDYGNLSIGVSIPSYYELEISDEQVSSQLQDSIAILLCGVFIGIHCYIPSVALKRKLLPTRLQ